MRARDVFEEAREARERIRALEERSVVMHERIGMQGRAMEAVFSQTLDPMRKVDDLIDWEAEEYDAIMASARASIADATRLLSGLARMGYGDAARTLELYYVDAMEMRAVSLAMGYDVEVVRLMLDTALDFIDEVGMAKVKEAR